VPVAVAAGDAQDVGALREHARLAAREQERMEPARELAQGNRLHRRALRLGHEAQPHPG